MQAAPLLAAPALARCGWCRRPLGDDAIVLTGRIACPCGAATTSPWPTDAELDAAYAGFYRPASGRFAGPGDRLLARLRGRLARRLDQIAPPGPVLDVGSGDGALLDALARQGRAATGLERHPVRPDVLDTAIARAGGPWAAVVMWHSLEHLRDPAGALADAAAALAPGGVLVIAVPNAASLQARTFGDRWFALDLPRHLVHLPASLVFERLTVLGLTAQRTSHWRGGQVAFGWLHGLVGTLPGHPDLYAAIRRAPARSAPMSTAQRALVGLAALAMAPLALAAAAGEVLVGRGGSVYVEARRGP